MELPYSQGGTCGVGFAGLRPLYNDAELIAWLREAYERA
jgi:hypothetical protein